MFVQTWGIAFLYAFTIIIGVFGNTWVAISVIRTRKPRSTMGLSPSDRLRSYIGLLAIVDLLVISALFIKFIHVIFPDVPIQGLSCQAVYVVDQLVKLASLTCLTCISFERYLTIAKPFKNTIRKRFIRFTPLVAIGIITAVLSAIIVYATNLTVTKDKKDCTLIDPEAISVIASKWAISLTFIIQLLVLCFNYGQIARHLRKKFWQRKSRICTNPRLKQPLVQQPKYMKDTTNVILRIATFHFLCWFPYCLIYLLPATIGSMSVLLTTKLRIVSDLQNIFQWIVFVVGWLAYLNSALNWIFYAVLNRDLRTIIRETTERRKRSTMSHQSPPSNLHQSLRRQISQSIRFFYSINSYRSTCNSFDESFNSYQHNRAENKYSNSIGGSTGALNNEEKYATNSFIPSIRTGRAHTFSSPRTSLMSQDSQGSLRLPNNGARFVAITSINKQLKDSPLKDSVERFV
uniref:G-protein coupled receptors family 1 profile domain-containing protein n=1 Tax=Panagrolaimus superbus TaxID=310955 RepID=A0A914Z2C4_9BILA